MNSGTYIRPPPSDYQIFLPLTIRPSFLWPSDFLPLTFRPPSLWLSDLPHPDHKTSFPLTIRCLPLTITSTFFWPSDPPPSDHHHILLLLTIRPSSLWPSDPLPSDHQTPSSIKLLPLTIRRPSLLHPPPLAATEWVLSKQTEVRGRSLHAVFLSKQNFIQGPEVWTDETHRGSLLKGKKKTQGEPAKNMNASWWNCLYWSLKPFVSDTYQVDTSANNFLLFACRPSNG